MIRVILSCLLLATGMAVAAHGPATDHEVFGQLLRQLKSAHEEGNASKVLSKSLELAAFLHYSGPAVEQVAMAYAVLGEREKALKWLSDFTAMGQNDRRLADRKQFDSVRSSPEFKHVLATMRENEVPINRASAAIRLHDTGLLPEDLDYDATTRSFLITSVLEKKIIRVDLDGAQTNFAASPDGWSMMAIRIDAKRGVVWATEVAMNHFADVQPKDWGHSALLCLRLEDGALINKINAPHTALGDLALMPNGDAIVSDGENGGVYQATAGCTGTSLRRIDSGEFISPQTPVPALDGKHVFVPDYVRGVALLDLDQGHARWINSHGKHAMQGIDGMYLTSGKLLAIQNGTSPERVAVFGLSGETDISSEKILDRSTPTLGVPTHGVQVGGDFYYIANSGWNSLDDRGRPKPGSRMTPAIIKKVALPTKGTKRDRGNYIKLAGWFVPAINVQVRLTSSRQATWF